MRLDDEFIGYIFRYMTDVTSNLDTNITGMHDVFKRSINKDYDRLVIQSVFDG